MNLLPVLLLAPLALSLPSPHLHRAQNHTFHLSNLTYSSTLLYSTPSHLAVSSATFSFAFSNPAAYPAQCIGHSSGQTNDAGFFAWPQIFTCTNEGAAVGHVTFAWDRYGGGVLSVKQTWECGGYVDCLSRAQKLVEVWPEMHGADVGGMQRHVSGDRDDRRPTPVPHDVLAESKLHVAGSWWAV
ncbi:hypothetical protein PMIN03_001220 [Paraphaeosphaeria minitans]